MNTAYLNSPDFSFFSDAQEHLDQIITQLQSEERAGSEHGEIEQFINQQGQELLRRLLQGWLDKRAANETQQPGITSVTGVTLNHVKKHTQRTLTSLFGNVTALRRSYSQRAQASVFPADGELNLPKDKYSDGLRHRVAGGDKRFF